jgi:hypothetical protein
MAVKHDSASRKSVSRRNRRTVFPCSNHRHVKAAALRKQ